MVEFNATLVGCICDGDLGDGLVLQPEAEVVGHKLSGSDFWHTVTPDCCEWPVKQFDRSGVALLEPFLGASKIVRCDGI